MSNNSAPNTFTMTLEYNQILDEHKHMKKALEKALDIANTIGESEEVRFKGMIDVVWEVLDWMDDSL